MVNNKTDIRKEWGKDSTRSRTVLVVFLLKGKKISYEYHEYHFLWKQGKRRMLRILLILKKGIEKSCFLVVKVVLVGKNI